MTEIKQSSKELPGMGNSVVITINNGAEKKDDKKDSSKGKPFAPERALYVGFELFAIHSMLTSGNLNDKNEPIYRSVYLASLVAGMAFGLYKSMTTGQEVGLEQRAEEFHKGKTGTKVKMLALATLQVPLAVELMKRFNLPTHFGKFMIPDATNMVPLYCGFSLGTDFSAYVCNNLFSKKQKS